MLGTMWAALLPLAAASAAPPAPPARDAGRYALDAATLEAGRTSPAAGRYRLTYELQPTAKPQREASRYAKAGMALCPLPGTLFTDGFESP